MRRHAELSLDVLPRVVPRPNQIADLPQRDDGIGVVPTEGSDPKLVRDRRVDLRLL
jgi:hypothetical protein